MLAMHDEGAPVVGLTRAMPPGGVAGQVVVAGRGAGLGNPGGRPDRFATGKPSRGGKQDAGEGYGEKCDGSQTEMSHGPLLVLEAATTSCGGDVLQFSNSNA